MANRVLLIAFAKYSMDFHNLTIDRVGKPSCRRGQSCSGRDRGSSARRRKPARKMRLSARSVLAPTPGNPSKRSKSSGCLSYTLSSILLRLSGWISLTVMGGARATEGGYFLRSASRFSVWFHCNIRDGSACGNRFAGHQVSKLSRGLRRGSPSVVH